MLFTFASKDPSFRVFVHSWPKEQSIFCSIAIQPQILYYFGIGVQQLGSGNSRYDTDGYKKVFYLKFSCNNYYSVVSIQMNAQMLICYGYKRWVGRQIKLIKNNL